MSDCERMPCDQVIARLWEYVDGEIEGGETVEAHLDICARCFPEYDFRRAYLRFAQRTARQCIPPSLRTRVFQAILEEERSGQGAPDAEGRFTAVLRRMKGAGGSQE